MADQTTVNYEAEGVEGPSRTMVRNVGSFTHDLTTLAELQAKLLIADLRALAKKMIVPISLGLIGALLLLAFLITLLEGLAFLFEEAGMSRAASFGLSALCGLVVGIILLALAWYSMRGSINVIKRSQDELKKNLQWLQAALRRSGSGSAAMSGKPSEFG